jgi:DNA invertase Pin-like site-specific DNA recombinase
MIAAIYARKSTDQTGVADEQKSIARQVEHARQYAARKGWTVDEAHVHVVPMAVLRLPGGAE